MTNQGRIVIMNNTAQSKAAEGNITMPVSLNTALSPFDKPAALKLRAPQARVLRELVPANPGMPVFDWPLYTRAGLAARIGFTPLSGTITRALNGTREGSSNVAHPGLLALGLVEAVDLDIDGIIETNYRITAAGLAAYQAFVDDGGKLPPIKNVSVCTNKRYRE